MENNKEDKNTREDDEKPNEKGRAGRGTRMTTRKRLRRGRINSQEK